MAGTESTEATDSTASFGPPVSAPSFDAYRSTTGVSGSQSGYVSGYGT
jgi:hypothetical protein